ncbi:TadE/TadG family type IV pilus assembly protein [Microbacterium sp. YY-01]|uniref:TadE/TadG family type IV pilus assembly protein n=1 Tax=Microbacterium sp. YY-01 TaxID=3421634 RepID=UPI003D1665B5
MRHKKPSQASDKSIVPDESTDSDEKGAAALEFVIAGVIMLVPLVYLIIALGTVQQQTFGVEQAARQTARLLAHDDPAVSQHADAVVSTIVNEYGIDDSTMTVAISCIPAGVGCPAPGTLARITVTAQVSLPLVPQWVGSWATVPVEASAVHSISQTGQQ